MRTIYIVGILLPLVALASSPRSAAVLLLCFVTAPNGRSHVEHGMIQQIHVG
jgi:hypothetical protein